MRAASHYGCTPEELAWKEVEKRHGFLKVRRGVIVEVDPAAPRREPGGTDALPRPSPAIAAPLREPVRPPAEERSVPAAETPSGPPAEERSRPPAEERSRPPAEEPRGPVAEESRPEPEPAPRQAGEGASEEEEVDRPWWAMPPAPAAGEAEPPEAAGEETGAQDDEGLRPRRRRGGRPRGRRRGGREAGASTPRVDEEITTLREAPAAPGERWPRAEGELADSALRWTRALLDLAGLDLDVDLFTAGEELLVELSGRHRELVVADRGRVLLAIQHLLSRLVRGDLEETPSVRVDSEGFQDLREETLRDLAQRAAERVRENRRPWLLEPMAPDERRIVHLTLADDPAVTTESLGEGYFKRVRIQPERSSRR
jgi:spoIIIJ-associated protein